jgi:hypothetical protein
MTRDLHEPEYPALRFGHLAGDNDLVFRTNDGGKLAPGLDQHLQTRRNSGMKAITSSIENDSFADRADHHLRNGEGQSRHCPC